MQTSVHIGRGGSAILERDLASFRYRIFVDKLGWQLPCVDDGLERDQYDRDDTVYIVARDSAGTVCGCARLLPTTRPYLLQEQFPSLLVGAIPPTSSDVWELSRLAINCATSEYATPDGNLAIRPMLAAVVECAFKLGARRLIGVTFSSMQRLFRRIGVQAYPAGPSELSGGRKIIACWIDIDAHTLTTLGLNPVLSTRNPLGGRKPTSKRSIRPSTTLLNI
ncbi:acyl-homoserine-lactone synthase [Burkholderia diffusa]|uniref:acyl-homoserine-lactone synthase n=1 Tax=Burkholderia diffusa TaxID=488732 RepID=UPI0009BF4A3E|nr:acyl-homoserine-lactone synthase [Burkholderia diffusa]